MDIERLKEDIRNVEYDLEYGEEQNQGRIAVNVNCLRSVIDFANEAIARQSVKSEEVAEAISWVTNTRHRNQYMSGDWTAPMGNHINRTIQDTIITALQAYQPTTRKDRIVEEVQEAYHLPSAIKWTGDNLREVISMTGWNESASSKWTWEEYEQVVKEKGLKIFTPNGSVMAGIGDWIVRDGDNCHVLQAYQPWISVEDEKPESGKHVLLCCEVRPSGKRYVCDGFYAQSKTITTICDGDNNYEYDEETDEYYLTKGYYEIIKNWEDYSSIVIEDFVTHWCPLPEPPKGERTMTK